MKTGELDTVAKLRNGGGALEVETSLKRLKSTSCLTWNARKQKSVCDKAWGVAASARESAFQESVQRSVRSLRQGETYGIEADCGGN